MDKTNPTDRLRAWAKLQATRDQDIRTAHQNGATVTSLADVTGLSRQYIHRIIATG